MTKKPEQVLVKNRVSTTTRVKECSIKIRSVSNIVIAPARTGSERRSKIAVTKTDQTKRGIRCIVIPGQRIFKIVVMKLTAPIIEEAPAK
jgi:hypothetical protein